MARTPRIALVGVLLLAAACGAERSNDAPVVLETAQAAASPTAIAVPPEPTTADPEPTVATSPTITAAPDDSALLTAAFALESRFPEATALIEEAPTRVGVAVLTPDAARHAGGDDGTFALASVAKLPVMLATLERARLQERELTAEEHNLLDLMITVSSNNATDVLWQSLGEGPGVAELLEPLGITSIEYAEDDQWGDSRASALDVAGLLELLVDEDSVLAPEVQTEALALMQSVVADQRWGASAGVDVGNGSGATLAIKNGWYPETTGWLLNSAGVISLAGGGADDAGDEATAHVVVVLTEGATTQTEGVRVIEEIAAAINHSLIPETLAVAPDSPTFAAATELEDDPADDAESAALPTPEPTSTPVALVAFARSSDVLVPTGGSLVRSAGTSSELTLWYELPSAAADAMLQSYGASMTELGWLQVAGPPSIVLAKSSEDRWVGLTAYPAAQGERLVELTIAPAPGVVPAGVDPAGIGSP